MAVISKCTIAHSSVTLTCLTFLTAMLPCNNIVLPGCVACYSSSFSLVSFRHYIHYHMSSARLNVRIHRSTQLQRASIELMTPTTPVPAKGVHGAPTVRLVVVSRKLVPDFVNSNCR
eukprot:UN21607